MACDHLKYGMRKTVFKKAHFVQLKGKRIDELIVKHGPFVMNTQQEIRDAMKEYGLTKFGGWPWP